MTHNIEPIHLDLTHNLPYTLFSIAAILFTVLTLISVFREFRAFDKPKEWYGINKDEYDFMATEESAQSRLDLARAYLDMNETQNATIILSELTESQNPIIRDEARQLIKNLRNTD